jgi:hypothetical protein
VGVATAAAHPGQHGTLEGHLLGTGEWGKIEFISQVTVHDAEEGLIADLTVFGDYAYLARFDSDACAGPEGGGKDTFDGGVYVIDISDLENPTEVASYRPIRTRSWEKACRSCISIPPSSRATCC